MAAVTIDQVISSPRVSARGERLGLLWRSPTFLVGSVIVLFWALSAIFGRLAVPHDPFQPDILHGLTPPSPAHWFGTDNLGRDVFSRVIVGARGILTVAPLATLVGTVLGTSIGLIAGFFRGLVDDVLMRAVDAFLAVPVVIVGLLALVALGPSNLTVILV
ncbi:MAG TPA: ABC transporter permease, partial [Candidatus Eisenbacteria bacterium]|nr:ABC transporter permease [Candidatus Eisenbacteria bacterium]